MTLSDFIYGIYSDLMENGWKMAEIDEMDMPGFLKIRAYQAKKEEKKKKPCKYIDEIWHMEVNT